MNVLFPALPTLVSLQWLSDCPDRCWSHLSSVGSPTSHPQMQCCRCQRLLARRPSVQLQSVDLMRWLLPRSFPPQSTPLHPQQSSGIQRRRVSIKAAALSHGPNATANSIAKTNHSSTSSPSVAPSASSSSLSSLLSPTRRRIVERIRSQLEELPSVLRALHLSADDRKLIRDTQQQLDQVFLLVVVGEYNAGKSSFLNALLGGEYCKTGLLPTTDKITILRYAAHNTTTPTTTTTTPTTAHIDDPNQPAIQSHYLPLPLLADLCIVDTPGTNAIIRSHEALTTHFVPRSDAVLFVTSVERPFSESERAFMGRIRQWGKKVVVVINKKDLTETDEDRQRIMQYVRDNVEKELHEPCTLFAVSARQAIQARAAASADELQASGIPQLERWLAEELSSSERTRLKLLSPVNVVGRILTVYEAQLREKESRSEADRRVMDEVVATMSQFERDVKQQADLEIAKLDSLMYDRMERVERVVLSNAAVPNMWSLFRGAWTGEWQHAFDGMDDGVRGVLNGLIDRVSECTKRAVTSINRIIQRHNQRLTQHALTSRAATTASSSYGSSETSPTSTEQSLVPLIDTATLWLSAPSHQQFVQLQQQVQQVLSPSAQQALSGQIRSTLTFAATLATSSAIASFAVLVLQLTHKLAFVPPALSWSPLVVSAVLAVSTLYILPLYRQRVVRVQRAEMERWRMEARRTMDDWTESEVEERKRRLASVRSDMERQLLGKERVVQGLRRHTERLEKEVVELREQIRVAQ